MSWFQNPDYSCFGPQTGISFSHIACGSLFQNIDSEGWEVVLKQSQFFIAGHVYLNPHQKI
jgi:hypothetical protein